MRKKVMWSLLGVTLAVVGIFGYYAYSFFSFADKISTSPKESRFKNVQTQTISKGGEILTPPKWEGKERVNILLLGGDSRGLKENEIPRSDSIMIVSLDPVTKKSYLFSILRDTYVRIPNNGSDRINTAIATGGPELAMKTVSNLMGIPIQYYVYTDFKGFIALVDAIDGIDMDVEKDMKYSDSADGHEYDINLKKGFQHLDGKTSLQYVRFRHDATSDFTRTERQRKFMKALAEKLQSTTSLLKLPRILQSMDPYIETNLTVSQMLKLGSLGFDVKTDGMVSQQIPPQDLLEEKRVGGAEVLGVDPARLQRFIKELFGETPEATKTPASGKVSMGSESEAAVVGSVIKAASTKAPAASVKPTKKPSATAKPGSSPAASSKPTPSVAPTKAPAATPKPSSGTGSGSGTGSSETGGAGGKVKNGKPATGATAAPTATPKPTSKTTTASN
jgi:LCP family protein required for cell wall assembly